jgi:hypothetical protein
MIEVTIAYIEIGSANYSRYQGCRQTLALLCQFVWCYLLIATFSVVCVHIRFIDIVLCDVIVVSCVVCESVHVFV